MKAWALAALLLLLTCCAGKPPEIVRTSLQLLYVYDRDSGETAEELAVHIVADDEDGLDDLECLYLISDASELYWSLDSESWAEPKSGSDSWIGSARLAMPSGQPFPRGRYRVRLCDLSGDSAEAELALDIPPLDRDSLPFPRAQIAGGRIEIRGSFTEYTLLVYNTAGAYARSVGVRGEGTTIDAIKRSDATLRSGFSFWVYTYWSRSGVGLLIGPYYVD